MSWTIFGAGDLVWDIIDAISSNEESLGQIVLNQKSKVDFGYSKPITVKKYLAMPISYEFEKRIFGFVDPNKSKFLGQIGKEPKHFNNLTHARSWVCMNVGVGFGNYFGPHSTVAAKANLGDFNYINRNASIGHHTMLGSYNHVGPGAIICGNCKIGNSNFFGAGCVIKDDITIGNNIIIGANALVTADLSEKGVYIGSPAKRIDSVPTGSVANFLNNCKVV
jgi:acetyltransferase-like isoleucine patch superfamily enzyme